tara:strand:+ start:2229 stop:2804 length:576 start_codon:yes stop_codon:yes gene_type:complete
MTEPSEIDQQLLVAARTHLNEFIKRVSKKFPKKGLMLEVGAQGRTQVQNSFKDWDIKSFDLIEDHQPDFTGDLTLYNKDIPDNYFDAVACLEVLEHTIDPFAAIKELRRICKDGGYLLISAPLNFRLHGPLPDCWRFTEYGWKVLLKDFEIIEMNTMETPSRPLFPVKYNIWAKVDKLKNINPRTMKFERK